MAAYQALQPRIARAGGTCIYLSKPSGWFAKAAKAAGGAPVVVNCKGIAADATPVLLTLAHLEALQRAAATVDALKVLTPDKLGIVTDGTDK
jgi:hypothetical protein